MGYITPEYYNDEYKGLNAGNELEKYIERASDLIDQVTNYKIKDFESLHEFIQKQVKKATAAQVEFYVMQGGDAEVNAGDDMSTVGIGSFNYSVVHYGRDGRVNPDTKRISPNALAYLRPTGLLYQGLGVVHNVYF